MAPRSHNHHGGSSGGAGNTGHGGLQHNQHNHNHNRMHLQHPQHQGQGQGQQGYQGANHSHGHAHNGSSNHQHHPQQSHQSQSLSHTSQHSQHPAPSTSSTSQHSHDGIVDVYATNLEEELESIRHAIEQYPFVAMDTEFPGVVARPIGSFKSSSDYHYQTLRCNVDLLRIIQLGITLCDAQGNLAEPVSTWQFNFEFSLSDDMYAPESIDLLTKSGINFKRHQEYGIDVESFGELLISSGLVLLDDVKWISFHSGYDFGYLLKLVSCAPLPPNEADFFELLKLWFPCIYDIKYLMRSCKSLKGGLQDVADELQVPRIGPQHQAGSDSLLTASTFFKMRSRYFEDDIDPKYLGNLYGLGTSSSAYHATADTNSASSRTPLMQHAPTPSAALTIAPGPVLPPVASAALPIKASPFKQATALSSSNNAREPSPTFRNLGVAA